MWVYEEEKTYYRKVVISCDTRGCNGVFTHISWMGDNSPRIEEFCNKCDSSISVKLHNIDESRILSRTVFND